jgi:hypothetical protein
VTSGLARLAPSSSCTPPWLGGVLAVHVRVAERALPILFQARVSRDPRDLQPSPDIVGFDTAGERGTVESPTVAGSVIGDSDEAARWVVWTDLQRQPREGSTSAAAQASAFHCKPAFSELKESWLSPAW